MTSRDLSLDGQTVVVLGASRGIGAASAIACAQAGADAASCSGASWDDLDRVGAEIAEVGGPRCDRSLRRHLDGVDRSGVRRDR